MTDHHIGSIGTGDEDRPWNGWPWPPYLPHPDGRWSEFSRDNSKLCVGPGWHPLIDTAFDLCSEIGSVKVTAVTQRQGRLVVVFDVTGAPRTSRYLLLCLGLRAALDLLAEQSLETCEVCGAKSALPAYHPRTKTFCRQCAFDDGIGFIPGYFADDDDGDFL